MEQLKTNGILSQSGIGGITTFDHFNPFADFLQEFSNITKQINFQIPKHGVTHHIVTTGPPVAELTRRLAGERLHVARTDTAHDRCRPLQTQLKPWTNPLHLYPRKMVIGKYAVITGD